jgi:hypothetical protein
VLCVCCVVCCRVCCVCVRVCVFLCVCVLVCVFFFIMLRKRFLFCLIGVQLLAGKTALCNDLSVLNKSQCAGTFVDFDGMMKNRVWQSRAWGSFDNAAIAFYSMLPVIGVSGWVTIL